MINGIIDSGQKIVTNGLVLHLDAAQLRSYPTTGTTWTDLSGIGYNGTLTNGPTFNAGNGGSIVFDGVNDFVNVGNLSSNINTATITFSVWLKWGQLGVNKTILGNEPYFPGGVLINPVGFGLRQRSGNNYWLSLGTNTGRIIDYTPLITLTDWHNVTVSLDGTTATFYINGISVASANCNFIVGSTTVFVLGRVQTPTIGEYFKGNVALFKLYNRALSATEVLQNFNATKSRYGL